MNTLKIGDKFEEKSYNIIQKAIENGELGIIPNYAKVFTKKDYYSRDRESYITFDLAIEIWPPNAERYTILYLIECKGYNSKRVPVDDVEEFYSKIKQVSGVNVKGVMISDNSFQSGGLTFAKNKGMMLIEVNEDENYSVILHRTERVEKEINEKSIDDVFSDFIKKVLGVKIVKGLKNLSAIQIEEIANSILTEYNQLVSPLKLNQFISFIEKEYRIKFDFSKSLSTVNGKSIKGYYDIEDNAIFIDNSILNSNQFPFILGHELGHFFLHRELKINQEVYNDFKDSEYDFFTDKFKLENDKNWIEWQANKFAISLFLPKIIFLKEFVSFRKKMGIRRHPEHIYLDDQVGNQKDYKKTVEHLSNYFGISKTSVIFRIENLKLITNAQKKEKSKHFLIDLMS